METQSRLTEMRQKLRDSGHRITPQRLCVLEALLAANSHPSAEEIHAQVRLISPTTSLATVYKTLDTLRDIGEVMEMEVGDGRSHYDGVHPQFHPHAICTCCGKITDIEIPGLTCLPDRAEEASGYEIHAHRVEFYGLCAACHQQKEENE